jgi:plasmid stabilization system protein ParE
VKVRILSCAEREFAETVDFYNEERPGLGFAFAAEVRKALDRIQSFPDAWPLFSTRARRCILQRFPYGILYQVRSDCILVLAIMHLKRDPQTWRGRIGDER